MTTMIKTMRVPITMLALASLLLVPTFFASAAERPNHSPAVPFMTVSVTQNGDGTGSIKGTLERVPEQLTQEQGVVEGDAVTINFTAETKFIESHEETTVDSLEVGEVAFALGVIDFESMSIDARAIVDKPLPPRFHIGEVVEVDTDANTILVKSLKPTGENGEYEYVFVTYDGETTFTEDREDTDESAISVGDKIHVRGVVNWESEEYLAEITADHVLLFDEELPPRPIHPGSPGQAPQTE